MSDLIHLDESVRGIAKLDDATRVLHILKEIFIYHPRALRVQQFINFLYKSPERYRPTGLCICGEPGSGKTAQLRAYERANPPFNASDGGRRLPVLYVQMEEQPKPGSMYREMLNAAGVPWETYSQKVSARERVVRALRALETRIVLIDEVHNMCDTPNESTMAKWLRMLSNHLRIPIVLSGTEAFMRVLDDMQMASRWPFVVELPLWTDSSEFQVFLNAWQRALPLRTASDLTAPEVRREILQETGGITDLIAKCLTYSAIAAIRLKRERITVDLLSWWRDPPMLEQPTDDPEAVARAWLADERSRPDPLKVFPLPAMRHLHRMAKVGRRGGVR